MAAYHSYNISLSKMPEIGELVSDKDGNPLGYVVETDSDGVEAKIKLVSGGGRTVEILLRHGLSELTVMEVWSSFETEVETREFAALSPAKHKKDLWTAKKPYWLTAPLPDAPSPTVTEKDIRRMFKGMGIPVESSSWWTEDGDGNIHLLTMPPLDEQLHSLVCYETTPIFLQLVNAMVYMVSANMSADADSQRVLNWKAMTILINMGILKEETDATP